MDTSEITKFLQNFINEQQSQGKNVDMDSINKAAGVYMRRYNSAPQENFDGFSPIEMGGLLYHPFSDECPIRFRTLTDNEILQIPIMRQVTYLTGILKDGDIKLTKPGYLPPKIVQAMYDLGTKDWKTDWYKAKTEPRVEHAQVIRIGLKECGLIKVRNNVLSLTAKGGKIADDWNTLCRTFITWLLTAYNVAYFDLYDDEDTGNVGKLYSLWLLHHYGGDWKPCGYYSDKYFKAFPSIERSSIYDCRIFERLFHYIGISEYTSELREGSPAPFWHEEDQIRKTPALELLFSFEGPSID